MYILQYGGVLFRLVCDSDEILWNTESTSTYSGTQCWIVDYSPVASLGLTALPTCRGNNVALAARCACVLTCVIANALDKAGQFVED